MTLTRHLPKDGVLKWRLCDLSPLRSLIFLGGKIVLVGDASQAMLPSAAQSAAMRIDDVADIAELLVGANCKADIPRILRAFQYLRGTRCIDVVENGAEDARNWHNKDDPTHKPTSDWV